MNLKARAKQLKTDIPAVYLCLKGEHTPFMAKLFAGITIAYALSFIDLIPDFIPILGYIDDIILLPLFILLTIHFIPKDLFEHYREEAKNISFSAFHKRWLYALPIMFIWVVIIVWILKAFIL